MLALGISMMFGIIFIGEEGRVAIASIVAVIMNPVTTYFGDAHFHVVIFIMATFTALYASLIQKYTIDWEKMRSTQEKMKTFQKEFREAQLSQNNYMIKKLEEERAEMMTEQMEMSKQQFKPMAYIGIISFPLFIWLYHYIDTPASVGVAHEGLTMVFPFAGEVSINSAIPFIIPVGYWLLWYFITSLGISQVVRKALNIGGV
jgi:uncharacterized membrane protein (DUF106 family)